jgi:hypothetical protein
MSSAKQLMEAVANNAKKRNLIINGDRLTVIGYRPETWNLKPETKWFADISLLRGLLYILFQLLR